MLDLKGHEFDFRLIDVNAALNIPEHYEAHIISLDEDIIYSPVL